MDRTVRGLTPVRIFERPRRIRIGCGIENMKYEKDKVKQWKRKRSSTLQVVNWEARLLRAAVALTQISAYSTHKNLVIRKIMEVMRTAMQKAGFSLNTSQTTHEASDHGRHASIVKGKRASFANHISVFR